MHTNAYKGGGGSDHNQNMHFVRMFIENASISGPLKVRLRWFGADLLKRLYLRHFSWDLHVLYINRKALFFPILYYK